MTETILDAGADGSDAYAFPHAPLFEDGVFFSGKGKEIFSGESRRIGTPLMKKGDIWVIFHTEKYFPLHLKTL